MNDKFLNQINPPKRRKDALNPYTISKSGDGQYSLSFKDGQGDTYFLEISEELYETFNEFELADIKELNIVDRHIEHSELTEESLNNRAVRIEKSVEDIVLQNMYFEQLQEGIDSLSDVQRRRLILHYFDGRTYEEIAEKERCSHVAIIYSVNAAVKNLKKYFNK